MSKQNQPSNDRLPMADPGSHAKEQQRAESLSSLDQVDKIVDRAHKEVAWVHEAYGRYARILGTILVTGITAATFLTWNNAREMKSDLNRQAIEISDRVNKRIDAEFSKEGIQNLVQKKAEERVDAVADGIITSYIDRIVKPRFDAFESKLKRFDERTADMEQKMLARTSDVESRLKSIESQAIAELRQTSEFVLVVAEAEASSRRAFDQLKKWAEDKNCPFSERARQARDKIINEPAWPVEFASSDVFGNADPMKLSLDKYRTLYPSASLNDRGLMLVYASERKDISPGDKMEFFVYVMKTDGDLRMVAQAARKFLDGSKQSDVKLLETDKMVDWWEKHKNEYLKEDQPRK